MENGYISLRGEAAAGSDLFVSLHTNANNNMANGYDTLMQPVSLNKPFVFLNTIARSSEEAIITANLIGSGIVEIYAEKELASTIYFQEVTDGTNLMEWTDTYNDSLDVPGTVCCRTGDDYYGVLRGAADAGVPGMIVEHGFHTIPEVRYEVLDGDLVQRWAEADARAIAEGFGSSKIQ